MRLKSHAGSHAPALAVRMHDPAIGIRTRMPASRRTRGSATHSRVPLECAAPRITAKAGQPCWNRRSAPRASTLTVGFHSISLRLAASCPHPASSVARHPVILTGEIHSAPSRFVARISTSVRATGPPFTLRRMLRRTATGKAGTPCLDGLDGTLTNQKHSVSSRRGASCPHPSDDTRLPDSRARTNAIPQSTG